MDLETDWHDMKRELDSMRRKLARIKTVARHELTEAQIALAPLPDEDGRLEEACTRIQRVLNEASH